MLDPALSVSCTFLSRNRSVALGRFYIYGITPNGDQSSTNGALAVCHYNTYTGGRDSTPTVVMGFLTEAEHSSRCRNQMCYVAYRSSKGFSRYSQERHDVTV